LYEQQITKRSPSRFGRRQAKFAVKGVNADGAENEGMKNL
jgi:hypothetical protein